MEYYIYTHKIPKFFKLRVPDLWLPNLFISSSHWFYTQGIRDGAMRRRQIRDAAEAPC